MPGTRQRRAFELHASTMSSAGLPIVMSVRADSSFGFLFMILYPKHPCSLPAARPFHCGHTTVSSSFCVSAGGPGPIARARAIDSRFGVARKPHAAAAVPSPKRYGGI